MTTRASRVAALLALGADAVLVALGDIHGAAAVAGAILAFLLGGKKVARRYSQRTDDGVQVPSELIPATVFTINDFPDDTGQTA